MTEATGAPPRWGIADAALAFGSAVVLSNITGGVAAAVHGGADPTDALPVQLAGLVGLWAGLVGGPVLVSRWRGSGSLQQDFGLEVDAREDVPRGLAVGLVSQFVLVPVVFALFRTLAPHVDLGDQARDLTGDTHGAGFFVRSFVFVVGAPIVEELFFRGLLLRALRRRLGSPAAVLASGVVFGLVHWQPMSAIGFAALFTALALFGVVLGVLAERSGRLGPGIVAHAVFNGATMIVLALS